MHGALGVFLCPQKWLNQFHDAQWPWDIDVHGILSTGIILRPNSNVYGKFCVTLTLKKFYSPQ